jgi:hypothetical protein
MRSWYGRRTIVVGGVADRSASELARADQSNRGRAGNRIASTEHATLTSLFGRSEWQMKIAKRLGVESAYRRSGRPRKAGGNRTIAPGLDRSDADGGAQFINIGPVSLSPRVPLSASISDLSCFLPSLSPFAFSLRFLPPDVSRFLPLRTRPAFSLSPACSLDPAFSHHGSLFWPLTWFLTAAACTVD